jgi:hypothetical protein
MLQFCVTMVMTATKNFVITAETLAGHLCALSVGTFLERSNLLHYADGSNNIFLLSESNTRVPNARYEICFQYR